MTILPILNLKNVAVGNILQKAVYLFISIQTQAY